MKCLLIIFVIARNSHLETKSRNRVQDDVVSGCAAYWFVLGAPVISQGHKALPLDPTQGVSCSVSTAVMLTEIP